MLADGTAYHFIAADRDYEGELAAGMLLKIDKPLMAVLGNKHVELQMLNCPAAGSA